MAEELQKQIDEWSQQIFTEHYQMSIGEVISLYESDDIDIHPEFQRFFRWSDVQKTRLIESLLLGIPIPPVFVATDEEGVWDVIDGVQRLSTIFQFAGVLKDENGVQVAPLRLQGTRYLPALDGMCWESEDEPGTALTAAQRRYQKRARLDIVIIERQSDPETKYELFQRLNSGGTQLSDQELRNCILVNLNRDLHQCLEGMATMEAFTTCVPLTEKQVEERYDVELVLRFMVLRHVGVDELKNIDVGEFLTDKMIELASDPDFDLGAEVAAFECTFGMLEAAMGESSFRRWDAQRACSTGAFSLSAYETIACGIGHNCDGAQFRGDPDTIGDTIMSLWDNPEFYQKTGSGKRASWRLPYLIPLGRRVFGPADPDV